jgi:hypothetical protein
LIKHEKLEIANGSFKLSIYFLKLVQKIQYGYQRRMKMQTTIRREIPKPASEILAYQHDNLLKRYSLDYGVSIEESRRCFSALKEVTSDPIDRMWHTFLLFTKDYKKFCEENLGVFINHEPFEHAAPQAYLETRAFAQEYFGRLDEELWSINAKADCSSGCGE